MVINFIDFRVPEVLFNCELSQAKVTLTPLPVAGFVGAVGIHVGDESELPSVRREDERLLHSRRDVRQLARLAARQIEEVHLRRRGWR